MEDDFAHFTDEEFLTPDSLLLPKALAENLVFQGTVYFLRCNYHEGETDVHRSFKFSEIVDISKEDAIRIYGALRNRFPELKFKLIILNQGEPTIEGLL